MSELKAGDVVFLKSGSLPMTIEEITQEEKAKCVWWNTRILKYEHGTFPVAILSVNEGPCMSGD